MIELLLQADRLLTVDLVDAADAIYRKVAEADPRNAIAVVGMARCALARGDDHEAYRLAARALAIDPQNDMARRMEARLDEVLRTRGEVPGQGAVASGAAASASEAAQGLPGVVAPPVKHRWPATPTTVRPTAVAPSADADADAAASSSSPTGSTWASRIHHEEPPVPARPPAPSSPPSAPSAQAVPPDQPSGTPGQSGTQAPSVAPSSPSKRSLLDRLRGR